MQINRRAFLAASSLAPFQMVGGVPPKTYPGYLSPIPAMAAPKEKFLFVTCSSSGMDTWEPDYLATVSVDKSSLDYSSIVSRVCMPVVGDELFRFGWNVCSSSHKKLSRRQFLVLPGMQSGRINIVDVEVPLTHQEIVGNHDPSNWTQQTGVADQPSKYIRAVGAEQFPGHHHDTRDARNDSAGAE